MCHSTATVEQTCPLDSLAEHHGGVVGGMHYCPYCGEPYCPDCGSHDVSMISRVTGYLGDVGNFNAGKRQELKDRTRYDVGAVESS